MVMTLRAMLIDLARSNTLQELGVKEDEYEEITEWMLKEAFQRALSIRVASHYRLDSYRCLYDHISLQLQTWWVNHARQVQPSPEMPPIEYVKIMLVGTVITIGVFRCH